MTPTAWIQVEGPVVTDEGLMARLERAHAETRMIGWGFSRLEGRLTADEPWWDFEGDCASSVRAARTGVLDLGTGGGERLAGLVEASLPPSPDAPTVAATEGWEPNLGVARDRLSPLGVTVVVHDSEAGDPLPFADATHDLVMARHESFDANEVARVLTRGGRLLTQQVDGSDAPELHDWFGGEFLYPEVTAAAYVRSVEAAGLRVVDVDQWEGTMRFLDVAALVTYLGLVPWDVPDFTVSAHADRLTKLQAAGPISITQRRFRVYAVKPR